MEKVEKTYELSRNEHKEIISNSDVFNVLPSIIGKDKKVLLDVGCRNLELLKWLKLKKIDHLIDYFGIDPFLDSGLKSKKILKESILDFRTKQKFDLIVISHVLEHLKAPYLALEKCSSFLKPGGSILVALPNPYTFSRYITTPLNLKNYPKINETHFQIFGKEEFKNLCDALNLKIIFQKASRFEFPLLHKIIPKKVLDKLSNIAPSLSEELIFILKRKSDKV
jgi:SAM-dependent methyltransferase